MNIDREILNIQDILQRADKDSEDIKSLLFASMALVKLKQVKTLNQLDHTASLF